MAKRNGGIIGPDNVPAGPLGSAGGVWRLEDAFNYQKAGLWPTPLGYQIPNSLRFNSGSSDYLNRTPASAGSATTWTVSFWLKRSNLGQQGFFGTYPNGNTRFGTDSNDAIDFYDNDGSFQWRLVTNRLFRDVSAWYHFVVQVDTTNATSSDRIKLYVNGVRETSFSTATYPSQNYAGGDWNDNGAQYIGTHATEYMNGYIAEFNNIDGQALTPSSFGQTDSTTGIWTPIAYNFILSLLVAFVS